MSKIQRTKQYREVYCDVCFPRALGSIIDLITVNNTAVHPSHYEISGVTVSFKIGLKVGSIVKAFWTDEVGMDCVAAVTVPLDNKTSAVPSLKPGLGNPTGGSKKEAPDFENIAGLRVSRADIIEE